MKRLAIIVVLLLCSAFISSSGQAHDTVKEPIVLAQKKPVFDDLRKDSLQLELNKERADKEKSFQQIIITLSDGETLR